MEKEEKKRSVLSGTPFVGIVVLMVVITGLVVDATKADGDGVDNFYSDIIRLDNVATTIHQNYVEETPSKDLVDNAIKGMLKILDPHTSYFEPKQYEELRIHTEGKFGGLGIQISIRDKILTVMTPIAGTPAFRAGIQSGDQIIKIDGKSTAGITVDAAVEKLRGAPGTAVSITIRRKGEIKDTDYEIKREVIHIKSVPYYGIMDNDIGYIQLSTFSQETETEVERAIKELSKKNIKGLVFDLRHNPGGLLQQAIEVAENFLPKKSLVVSTRGRSRGQNKEYYSGAAPILPDNIPLAVLIDYASASASEIVSGAIQDYDRGVVIGDTSFGKGSVQSILPLDKTHHLKLTTAFYYTPSGRCINRPENAVRGAARDADELFMDEEGGLSSDSSADSLKKNPADTTIYLTKNGRKVYGGGGIIPDTIVEPKTLPFVIRALYVKDAFFQFANLEYPKLKKKKVKIDENFAIDDAVIDDFHSFLDSSKFEFQTVAQIKFDEFKRGVGLKKDSTDTAKNPLDEFTKFSEAQLTSLKKVTAQMDSLLLGERKNALDENEDEVKRHLKEALIIREYGQDHETYYNYRLNHDQQLKAAIEILKSKPTYSLFLKSKAAQEIGKR